MIETQSFSDSGPAVSGVRCAAHTLQLAVEDALKKTNVSATIVNARNVCIKLRTPNIRLILKEVKEVKLPVPLLDCPTRYCRKLNI